MVTSRSRQPLPALPDPYEQDQPRDRTRRRVDPQGDPSRQPRINLDGLAIGTPLTAALIGVLLTQGDGALGDAGAAAEMGGAAARRVDEAGGVIPQSMVAARPDVHGEGGAVAGAGTSTGGEIFDPIVGAQAAALAQTPAAGMAAGGLDVASGAAATLGAKTPLIGAINISIGTGAPLQDGLGEPGGNSDPVAEPDGRIGGTIIGTDGDDVIHGTPHDDRLFGGAGDDTIHGHAGDDLLDGGAGDDRLFGGAGDDELLGGSGDDRLAGGTGEDRLSGGTGEDRLFGEEGRDWLDGGAGNDLVDGGTDADRMTGGAGDDRLVADHLHDLPLESGRGPDGGGSDILEIAADFADHLPDGTATFVFSESLGAPLPSGASAYRQQVGSEIEHVTLHGSANHDVIGDSGDNRLIGNAGDNRLYGDAGDDRLIGNAGADRLYGEAGRDRLEGGAGDDLLKGGGSDDELYGSAGDDILDGGAGSDLLYGGPGDDNFLIGLNDSAIDTVFDHEGRNWLTIEDGAGHHVQTAVVGGKLHVIVDNQPVAIVDDYVGNEDAFAGIEAGSGLRTIDELMARGAADGPALVEATSLAGSTADPEADVLGGYLSGPSLRGTTGADHLIGTSASDWLQGDAGADRLVGDAGNDVIEGGAGADLLEGGAGDDRYLLKAEHAAWDIIRDTEGSNLVELDGFSGAQLRAVVLGGKDLVIVADSTPILTFENFVGNEQAFAGVQVGDEVVTPEDLLS